MKTKQLHNQLDTIERMHAHLIKRINVAQQGFTLQVYSKAVPDPDGKHRWRVVASNAARMKRKGELAALARNRRGI